MIWAKYSKQIDWDFSVKYFWSIASYVLVRISFFEDKKNFLFYLLFYLLKHDNFSLEGLKLNLKCLLIHISVDMYKKFRRENVNMNWTQKWFICLQLIQIYEFLLQLTCTWFVPNNYSFQYVKFPSEFTF